MRKFVGLLAFAAALVTGCGTVQGQAEPSESGIKEPAFSPCDDIPDDAIRAAGFDPATKRRDILGVKQPGWNICAWRNGSGSLSVFSNRFGLDDVRANTDYRDFREIEIGGQPGLAFLHTAKVNAGRCYAATETPQGMLMVAATFPPGAGDPCAIAYSAAEEILPFT